MRKIDKIVNWLLRRKRKIAINVGIGGFGLSDIACERLMELGVPESEFSILDEGWRERYKDGIRTTGRGGVPSPNQKYYGYLNKLQRDDPRLIQVIEELGHLANGEHATIGIAEIPAWIDWSIDEAETGYEWVQEKHRTWDAKKTYLSTFELVCGLITFAEMFDTWMTSDKISSERKNDIAIDYNNIIKELEARGLDPEDELKKELDRREEYEEAQNKLIKIMQEAREAIPEEE